jgi:hypothetical protein
MALQRGRGILWRILLPDELDEPVLADGMSSGRQQDLEDLPRARSSEVPWPARVVVARDVQRSERSNVQTLPGTAAAGRRHAVTP